MDRAEVVALLDGFQAAQNAFYNGQGSEALRALMTADIVWSVPGDNAITGYRGIDEVLAYLARRRALARKTLDIRRVEALVGERDRVGALMEGTAVIRGELRR